MAEPTIANKSGHAQENPQTEPSHKEKKAEKRRLEEGLEDFLPGLRSAVHHAAAEEHARQGPRLAQPVGPIVAMRVSDAAIL